MEVRTSAAKIDAMLELKWQQVLDGAGRVDGTAALKALNDLESQLLKGLQGHPPPVLQSKLDALRKSIEPIKDAERAEAQVSQLAEQKRKFTETHYKNLQLTAQTFSLQEIGALVGVLGAAIKLEVKDRQMLGRIFQVFDQNMRLYVKAAPLEIEGAVVDDE
jgi:hypothetical protein